MLLLLGLCSITGAYLITRNFTHASECTGPVPLLYELKQLSNFASLL